MDFNMPCDKCSGTGFVKNPIAVGGELRRLRERSKKTMSAVAKRLGFSKAYLSDLERGRRKWNTDLITRFTKVCEGKI